jgi:tRNA(His) 5'-end guanylyltransferase
MEAVIFAGLHASGKSSFYTERFFRTHVRISLFHRGEASFDRKLRKLNSILAGEASGRFSVSLGAVAAFDCRISRLPNVELVIDYFRWRTDAFRNALNACCYCTLRDSGTSVARATSTLSDMPVSAKNELLFEHGINVNDIPTWQRRGIGLYWEMYGKEGVNRLTGEPVISMRRRIVSDFELPRGDAYGEYVARFLPSG